MVKILSENKYLFFIWSLLLISGSVFSAILGKSDTHLFINSFHSKSLDYFMLFITNLGDGSVMVFAAFLLIFRKVRYYLILIFSFLSTSLLVQLLKRIVFSDFPRPVKFFEGSEHVLHLIPGLKYHSFFSFPSGHSATAFAMFIGLALIVKNQWLKYLFLLTAVIVAFSRVYLSQHFLIDILAGSTIGVFIAVISHYWFMGVDKRWMDLPVHKAFRSK